MNARFWVWWNNDWVKLTLAPSTVIHLYEAHETDEGYSFQDELFEHDGDNVIRRSTRGGQDCDGPIEHHDVSECHLSALTGREMEPDTPPWRRIKAWQRDTFAEQMGY